MTGFLGNFYLWVKAAHIIFVIFWMAGLFLFPRYLIHHQDALGTPEAAAWMDRETKLRRMILSPSMGLVWLLGLALAANVGLFDGEPGLGWLHAKLLLVFALSGYHGWAVGYGKKMAAGFRAPSDKSLRMMNEIPGVATAIIVILVIVRPF